MIRLFQIYLRPMWITISFGLFLSLVGSLINVAQPMLIRQLINGLSHLDSTLVFQYVAILMVIPIISSLLTYFQTYVLSGTGQRVTQKLRSDVFSKFMTIQTQYIDDKQPGELYQSIQDAVLVGEGYIDRELVPAFLAVASLIFMIVSMFWMDTLISVLLMLMCLIGILLTSLTGNRIKTIETEFRETRVGSAGFLQEVLSHLRTVRLFGGQSKEQEAWGYWLQKDFLMWIKRRLSTDFHGNGILSLMRSFSISIVAVVGFLQIKHHNANIGTLVALLAYIPMLFQSIQSLQLVQIGTKRTRVILEKLYEIIDYPSEFSSNELYPDAVLDGSIKFEEVKFNYSGRQDGLLDVNFGVKPGTTTLVVGGSGSGKSTIIDLITGLYEPTSGSIQVCGIPIDRWNKKHLRSCLGVVPQDVVIWNRSLRDNLLYGIPRDRKITDEEIITKIASVGLDSLLERLPFALDSTLGPNAVQASGGERQRIALVRALLRNPQILIFDEVTSALDPILTEGIYNLIDKIPLTKLIVSHRISSLASKADQIVVVNPDGTVSVGTHDDLRKENTLYDQLITSEQNINQAI